MFDPPVVTGAVPAPASTPTAGDEQLTRQIEEAIRAGCVVTIANLSIRYCKRGQEFAEEDQHFRALTSGLFLRMNVSEGTATQFRRPARRTWGYYAPLDELEAVTKAPLAKLTPQQRAELNADLHRWASGDRSSFEPKPAL